MQYFDQPLDKNTVEKIAKKYGNYLKVTADLENKCLVAGCRLHADGEKILLDKGAKQENIWGGGINLNTKEVDATAVLNLRPRLDNNSLEIIDPIRREKFTTIVTKIFKIIWER